MPAVTRKNCCQRTVDELAATDALVEILLAVERERDLALRTAAQAEAALQRVDDLHRYKLVDGDLWCPECNKPSPCPTNSAARITP